MRLRARTLAPVLAFLLLAGCGTGASEQASERVVNRFQSALAHGDVIRACTMLSEHLKQALARDEGDACPETLADLRLGGLGRVTDSRVYITSALVTVARGGDAFLDETPEGWRISAAGCTRSGARYECRLED
jgi:hypothetical protein